jgi:hypothetical protein
MALAHLGVLVTISNIDTEDSAEARVCRLFYEKTKNTCLTNFVWPFARKFKALSLVEETPNDDWDFSYRYPNDCLLVQNILSGLRNDTLDSEVKFILGQDNAGELIFTDMNEAWIQYTAKCENPNVFPDEFDLAHSFLLAYFIVPAVAKGDPFKLGMRAYQSYEILVNKAASNALNEQRKDNVPVNSLIISRE